jgi:hypothetical protein
MARQQPTCSQCGNPVYIGIRYCGRCGAQLPERTDTWTAQQHRNAVALGIGLAVVVLVAAMLLLS